MNVFTPNSGLFSLAPAADPAGRSAPSDPANWSRLDKPLVLPAPYTVSKVAIQYHADSSRAQLTFRAAGPGQLEPWFNGPVQIDAPPPHPSFFDPMHELSDNSPRNRAEHLWGTISLNADAIDVATAYGTESPRRAAASKLWAMLLLYFETFPEAEGVKTVLDAGTDGKGYETQWTFGLSLPRKWLDGAGHHVLAITRGEFWASSPPACPHLSPWVPLDRAFSPAAPAKPEPGTVVYQRYIPALSKVLRYRLVNDGPAPRPAPDGMEKGAIPYNGESADASGSFGGDVPLFGMWQNSDRVNAGWRQRGPLREHYDFVHDCVVDEHRWGMIGTWQDEDGAEVEWGYVELYWPAFSNIARWAQPSDLGLHALVGNEKYRGPGLVRTWMGAGVHLAFLLSPVAQRCLSEPRASNTKMVGYECLTGGQVERLIDLGHKRSALVVWQRAGFFQLCPMAPLAAHVPRG